MYSNAVKIGALNDYLNPSEECVLPLLKKDDKYEIKLNSEPTLANGADSTHTRKYEDIYRVNNLKVTHVGGDKRITVGLSDCLSCSGCLTSSEEVLMRDDSYLQVLDRIRLSKFAVVSISPQTLFMFSSYYEVPPETVLKRLSYLFKSLGVKLVFDIALSEMIALDMSKEEFLASYSNRFKAPATDTPDPHPLDVNHLEDPVNGVTNGTKINQHDERGTLKGIDLNGTHKDSDGPIDNPREGNLPVISSHCPGWTLYAEKTLDQQYVDLISKVPSSQIIQGLLVKILIHTFNYYRIFYYLNYFKLFNPFSFISTLSGRNCNIVNVPWPILDTNEEEARIYHVSIVPCYDKKLEMIRNEYRLNFRTLFFFNDPLTRESQDSSGMDSEPLVDDILSTGDVKKILNDLNTDFNSLKEEDIDSLLDYTYYFNKFSQLLSPGFKRTVNADLGFNRLMRASQVYAQSGGFSEEIFKYACQHIFGKLVKNVQFNQTLNDDFKESVLYDDEGNVLLRFLIAYGFKNIQNVIKLLKQGRPTKSYDYVELMSCPGGCFNGAGQTIDAIRPPSSSIARPISNIVPKRYLHYFKPREREHLEISSSAFQKFLNDTDYVSTDNPVCKFFSTLIESVRDRHDFYLNLKSHKNVNIKW